VGTQPGIKFRLDRNSGVPPSSQLINQIRLAIRRGNLCPGDQLPTVREVVDQLAINHNTVHRAYRALEHEGLLEGRWGKGTFIRQSLPEIPDDPVLHRTIKVWIRAARDAGFSDEAIIALVEEVLHSLEKQKKWRLYDELGQPSDS
jgi:GntR family transcriptional regulator